MKEKINALFRYPKVPKFAQENFRTNFIQSDRVMIVLILLQWFVATLITSKNYDTHLYGFFGGGLISFGLIIGYFYFKGTLVMRVLAAIAMMLFSMIFIQQYLGRIEMHFHIFIAMAILTIYKDPIPVFVAAITSILHHFIFNLLQFYEVSLFEMPVMIFNYGCGLEIVFLHVTFVIIEAFVLGYIIKLQVEYMVELNRSEKEISGLNRSLSYSSMHDNLTGLLNRNSLQIQLDVVQENSKRNKHKFALLFLDLDHFKYINDTLGHHVGDVLLKTVAKKLTSLVRNNDLVARIGGDEFIIVINEVNDTSSLDKVIMKILEMFRKEWLIKGNRLRLSSSIGVSIYPDDSVDITELMKFADIAMYKAKSEGRDQFSFFTKDLNSKIHEEVDIANDMHRAFDEKEFCLYYQPKIEISSGRIIGAEALLRWNHHQKGQISPVKFIHIAEHTGFILPLGRWVMEETIEVLRRMKDQGIEDVHISCNVSTRQFQNIHLFSEIESAIRQSGINPNRFAIEITESVMIEYLDVTLDILQKIKQLGVHICMDDFGTGYSSLSYLQSFPIDSLKIDKSFVDAISKEKNNSNLLIDTIIAMGKALNLHVIAEGIEEEYQLEYLRDRGCNYYQGYYYSKPIPEDEFMKLLAASRQ